MAQGQRPPRAFGEGFASARARTNRDKVVVPCPHCGHQQLEPPTAISTNCRACGKYFLVQEGVKPPAKAEPAPLAQKIVTCFECGLEQPVSVSAQSSMCRKC